MSSQQSTSETSPVALSELEQQKMLEWKEKQELAEAQEQEILEQDLKYRQYAEEQNEKYNKYNDDMKNFTLADTPKVQIYKNYVLYDRFMP
jgi:predicted nucleic acid-binding protein